MRKKVEAYFKRNLLSVLCFTIESRIFVYINHDIYDLHVEFPVKSRGYHLLLLCKKD